MFPRIHGRLAPRPRTGGRAARISLGPARLKTKRAALWPRAARISIERNPVSATHSITPRIFQRTAAPRFRGLGIPGSDARVRAALRALQTELRARRDQTFADWEPSLA